ncbi:hypothetical protein O4H49_04040 [Kiloniella laminariae]|uniref:DUF304 domain-containing protein n=1 Tax=Kiloniella laminariae TaxID=454162 RepID=A0ABT4LFQ8_9PROT|nr:hypothetical protein [Kiloniella laminariae]MCZ4279935.1 hypothetical protein [Kiloniella laminariae]
MNISIEFATTPLLAVVEVIGIWFGAIATTAAVIASLYLGLSARNIRLDVNVSLRKLVYRLQPEKTVVCVEVVNKGLRKARVVSIGWSLGFLSIHAVVQQPGEEAISAQLPQDMDDSDVRHFCVELKNDHANWLDLVARDVIKTTPKFMPWQLTLYSWKWIVVPQVGNAIKARPNKILRNTVKRYILDNEYHRCLPDN